MKKLSKTKQAELAWLRDSLFPEGDKLPEPIDDPMGVAWAWKGLLFKYSFGAGHQAQQWIWNSPGWKAYLLAVAYLNTQGIPATPQAVKDLMQGPCYQVVSKHLRWGVLMPPWWDPARREDLRKNAPLTRVKYGRTHAYFIRDPKQS